LDRTCQHGDGCPSLRLVGQAPCHDLHSADIATLELPPWARETALTFMGAHPSARVKRDQQYDCAKGAPHETAWKEGLKQLVSRWMGSPEVAAMEAPAVPAQPAPQRGPLGGASRGGEERPG
jgi:hypothetical protein